MRNKKKNSLNKTKIPILILKYFFKLANKLKGFNNLNNIYIYIYEQNIRIFI